MQGLPGMYPKMCYTITGQDKFLLDGLQIFKAGGKNYITNAPAQDNLGRGMGSMISPLASLERYGPFLTGSNEEKNVSAGGTTVVTNPTANSGVYPFVSYYATDGSPNIPLTGGAPPANMSFKGGPLTITLYAADDTTGVPLQTINMTIPDAPNLPVPHVCTYTTNGGPLFFGTAASPTFTPGRSYFRATDDVIRGVEVAGPGGPVADNPTDTTASTNTTAGDVRLVAALETVGTNYYHAHQNWSSTAFAATGMEDDDGSNGNLLGAGDQTNVLSPQGDNQFSAAGSHGVLAPQMNPRGTSSANSYQYKSPYVPSRTYTSAKMGVTRTNNVSTALGDWDAGFALLPDGAHINMGDIGDGMYVDEVNYPTSFVGLPRYPYVQKEDHFNSDYGAGSYFSPNRQVPSSMILGSIPTGIQRLQPWQTLLFNPKPEDQSHPGRRPPDGLLASRDRSAGPFDRGPFWMPVVQPYPISQPFSTAGKINLNYQIEPFNYITRASGIYALMTATKMMAIPASIYKTGADPKPLISLMTDINNGAVALAVPPDGTFRYPINIDETLGGFTDKFATNDIFRSASQIAELNLVPQGASPAPTHTTMASFWNAHTMTGDNLREKPYVDLYPRVTTKSNAYTVHFRVQVLQKVPSTSANQWVEGKDQIISEYRGSSEIERYLDSASTNLPDFANLMATNPTSPKLNLDNYYRYRVISTKRFSPY